MADIINVPPCLSFLFEELASFILEGAFLTVIFIVAGAALSADAVIVAVPVDFAVTVPSLSTTATLLLLLVYLILLLPVFKEEPLTDALSWYSSFFPKVTESFDNLTLVVTKLPDGTCSTGSGVLAGTSVGVPVGTDAGTSVVTGAGVSVVTGSSGTLLPSKSVVNAFIHILLYPLE